MTGKCGSSGCRQWWVGPRLGCMAFCRYANMALFLCISQTGRGFDIVTVTADMCAKKKPVSGGADEGPVRPCGCPRPHRKQASCTRLFLFTGSHHTKVCATPAACATKIQKKSCRHNRRARLTSKRQPCPGRPAPTPSTYHFPCLALSCLVFFLRYTRFHMPPPRPTRLLPCARGSRAWASIVKG